jgi:hypothetical protein
MRTGQEYLVFILRFQLAWLRRAITNTIQCCSGLNRRSADGSLSLMAELLGKPAGWFQSKLLEVDRKINTQPLLPVPSQHT